MIRWSRRIVTSSGTRFAVDGLACRSLTRSFTASGLIRSVADEGDKAPVYSLSDFPVTVDELTVNAVASSESVVNVATHELTWRPTDMVMWLIDNIHVVYNIPYWESIVVTTLGLRFLMLPLAIKTVQNASRMAVLRPHMQRTQEAFLKDPRYEEMDTKLKYQNDIKALFKEHKVNPFRSLLMPLAQIPVFLSFFLGLREMSNHFPEMKTGGAYWFVDLSIADPYCIFPILNAVSFLFMIEMSAADGAQSPQQQSMLWVFRGLALAIGPLTMSIPQSVFVYWTTNNAVSIVQSIVLRQDAVRKFLDIPKPPPPDTVTPQNNNNANKATIHSTPVASSSSPYGKTGNKDADATEAEYVDKKIR